MGLRFVAVVGLLSFSSASSKVKLIVPTKASTVEAAWGPGNCVTAWKNGKGTCVMQTRCIDQDISGYVFSLLCVEKSGAVTKHIFGKNSFDPEETFDSLIPCHECRADPGAQTVNKHVVDPDTTLATLSADVAEIKADMTAVVASVHKLNVQVFSTVAPSLQTPTPITTAPSVLTAVVANQGNRPSAPQLVSHPIQRTFLGSNLVKPPSPMPEQVVHNLVATGDAHEDQADDQTEDAQTDDEVDQAEEAGTKTSVQQSDRDNDAVETDTVEDDDDEAENPAADDSADEDANVDDDSEGMADAADDMEER